MVRTLGAILIILSCGGFGISLAAAHKAQERAVGELMSALEFMECELRYNLTPLPELCAKAGENCKGIVGEVFRRLSKELTLQTEPDATCCLETAVEYCRVQGQTREQLLSLGNTLGRFDLEGQLQGIESVHSACERILEQLSNNREMRLRSYQTLGLCAGAALVILFI
ncbi:MAG: stage III sporulation protein AB [Oscillospiraceae bacterium]|nr:stage III sporulation protein AB [Oscillospiraceae bacterium]